MCCSIFRFVLVLFFLGLTGLFGWVASLFSDNTNEESMTLLVIFAILSVTAFGGAIKFFLDMYHNPRRSARVHPTMQHALRRIRRIRNYEDDDEFVVEPASPRIPVAIVVENPMNPTNPANVEFPLPPESGSRRPTRASRVQS